MSIVTFRLTEVEKRECHVVIIGIHLREAGSCEIQLLTVPFICDSLAATPIQFCWKQYNHLKIKGLDINDMAQDTG